MERPAYDVAILGGGLAGLSLAVRLADLPHLRTVVIEPREALPRDRTWSSWRLVAHPFADAVASAWEDWEVMRHRPDGGLVRARQSCPALPYETIPSDRLWTVAERRLAGAPHVELRFGCAAEALEEREDRVAIRLAGGGTIEAAWVFDSRPPAPDRTRGDLVQRFLGQEVRTDRPVFDPGCATLMDFAVRQEPGLVRFLYVLPSSPTEALVEDTWFAPADAPLPDHRAAVAAYLRERFGVERFEVLFEEQGAIPMSPNLQAPRTAGRVVPIGATGGALKPSSGYGFLAIQRMTDALAAALAAGLRPEPFQPRGAAARWMDSVFLDAIRHGPASAPDLFVSLFRRCPPGPLLRFLNDVGSARDTLRVIAATPKRMMIAAALRLAARRPA